MPSGLPRLGTSVVSNTVATIAQALQAIAEEHLFALQQALTLYRTYHEQVAQCDRKIQAH